MNQQQFFTVRFGRTCCKESPANALLILNYYSVPYGYLWTRRASFLKECVENNFHMSGTYMLTLKWLKIVMFKINWLSFNMFTITQLKMYVQKLVGLKMNLLTASHRNDWQSKRYYVFYSKLSVFLLPLTTK